MDDVSVSGVAGDEGEHEDGEDHAEDGDGEANVGDVLQLVGVNTIFCDKLGMDIEDESKVCEMVTGALGVSVVVAESDTTISGPDVFAETPEGAGDVPVSMVGQEEGDWLGEVDMLMDRDRDDVTGTVHLDVVCRHHDLKTAILGVPGHQLLLIWK